jgi:hypothetical protein
MSGRYSRWMAGAALGMGVAAVLSVLLFVASLIEKGSLPWQLSLIFATMVGMAALACGVAGWQWVKATMARGKWLAGIALGVGTAASMLLLLTLLEVFMLVGHRLYLTALACAVVLCPAAFVFGTAGWHRVKNLARQRDLWLAGASSGLLVIFMIICGQLYVAALVYAVLVLGTAALACVFDWRRVKKLVGQGRWIVGTTLGVEATAAILILLVIALLIAKRL